jgi:Zn-dependent M28 family amino/carboxypeptidase
MSKLSVLALVLLFWTSVAAQKLSLATEEDIKTAIALAPCKNSDRLAAVEKLFRSMGAADADIAIVEKKGTRNLIVTKPGTEAGTIIVGAHYDKVRDGCGAIDNWSGIVVIAHLYQTMRQIPNKKTLKFIAFDREEEGLVGSSVFVSEIPKAERLSICSMVNLDSFGFATPQVMDNASTPTMTKAAKELWKKQQIDIADASIPNADADSGSFVRAGIPAITFHGLSNNWQKYLHSDNDKLSNVNPTSVYMGYRYVLPFIAQLDSLDCDVMRKK